KRFAEFVGENRSIESLGRKDFVRYRDLLRKVPRNATVRFQGLSFEEAAKKASGEESGLSPTTVNKHLTNLATLFQYAADRGWVQKNEAKGLGLNVTNDGKYRTFAVKELNKLLVSDPTFKESLEPVSDWLRFDSEKVRFADYWAPLIALFTGMRINEICQLYIEDLKLHEGVHYFHVRAELDDEEKESGKKTKTRNSNRQVPIHPTLKRIGLIEFVNSVKEAGCTRIFPELQPDAYGNISSKYSKRFGRRLKRAGVKQDRSITFHSFRHTFRDALRRARVPEEIADRICGWSSGKNMGRHYGGSVDLVRTLFEEISKVEYEGLNLDDLLVNEQM
ncbi:site-specific integrase, partial [Opitutaceae bacterium]|nr:site-specific integrase [Opitutaceae bacterium]